MGAYRVTRLTPVEAEVEGMIRRDPLRRLPLHTLDEQRRDAELMMQFYWGTTQSWRCEPLQRRIEAIRREIGRRRGAR